MKYAQAVIVKQADGKWKLFFQSTKQIEKVIVGDIDDIINDLLSATALDWDQSNFIERAKLPN